MNTNEQQWQECPLEEATHAKTATGKVYELSESTTYKGQKYFVIYCVSHSDTFYSSFFPALGITPVRKAEVKPLEFTARAKTVGDYSGEAVTIIKVPAEYEGKTFKCVEVQP